MERLTEWYDDGISKGVLVKEEYGEQTLKTLFEESDEGYRGMCTLKAYEETGLTPEQIREIDRLYTEKCREVAELRQRDTAILPENIKGNKKDNGRLRFGTCPKCKACVTNVESGNYCQNCGQRLKWEERYAGIREDSGRDKGYAGR